MSSPPFTAQQSNYISLVHSFYYLPRMLFCTFLSLFTHNSYPAFYFTGKLEAIKFPCHSDAHASLYVHTFTLLFITT